MITTFEQSVNYILDIPKFSSKKNDLEVTNQLVNYLVGKSLEDGKTSEEGKVNTSEKSPEAEKSDKFSKSGKFPKIIHVAGTNGKGSVCSYLSNILKSAGYRVGLFTSPHLEDIRERITINGEMISESDFTRITNEILVVAEELNAAHPTFFEFMFLMGMKYYYEKQCDYIILETGLGGRLDATNSVKNKALTIITEIGLDHVQYLGGTYAEIAYEKAGIIRANVPVVFYDKRPESTEVILRRCKELNAESICVSKNNIYDIKPASDSSELNKDIENMNRLTFSIDLPKNYKLPEHLSHSSLINLTKLADICLNTSALYQTENASLAICGAIALRDEKITEDVIREGVENTFWPGRMEYVGNSIYLDGAHNPDGIEAMLSSAKKIPGRKVLLFAVVNDKDYSDMIGKIIKAECFDTIIVTVAGGARQTDADEIKSCFESAIEQHITESNCKNKIMAEAYSDLETAYNRAKELKGDNTLIVSGSLYLIGSIRSIIGRKK